MIKIELYVFSVCSNLVCHLVLLVNPCIDACLVVRAQRVFLMFVFIWFMLLGGVGFCICYGCSFESCSSTASHGKFVILVFSYLLVYVVGYDVVCLLNHVRILLMYF